MDMFASSLDFSGNARQLSDVVPPSMSNGENGMSQDSGYQLQRQRLVLEWYTCSTEGEDHDLDEYLYGADNTTAENRSVRDTSVEERWMTDAAGTGGSIDSPLVESGHEGTPSIQTPEPSRKSEIWIQKVVMTLARIGFRNTSQRLAVKMKVLTYNISNPFGCLPTCWHDSKMHPRPLKLPVPATMWMKCKLTRIFARRTFVRFWIYTWRW